MLFDDENVSKKSQNDVVVVNFIDVFIVIKHYRICKLNFSFNNKFQKYVKKHVCNSFVKMMSKIKNEFYESITNHIDIVKSSTSTHHDFEYDFRN